MPKKLKSEVSIENKISSNDSSEKEYLSSKNMLNNNTPYGSVPTGDYDEDDFNSVTKVPSKKDIISSLIVASCVLIGDMARGILFPTLWLFVQSLGGNKFMQGVAVSSFSIGRIVSAPIFGHFSEIYGYRYVLILCNIIIVVGCYVYTLAETLQLIIFSQLLIGFGAGR